MDIYTGDICHIRRGDAEYHLPLTATPAGTAPAIVHSPDPDADKRHYAFLLDDGQFLLPSGCDTLLVESTVR